MKKFFIPLIFALILVTFTQDSSAQNDDKLVILHTNSGQIVIEFFPEDAPGHVENFINLTKSGFYDNTLFHRIIKDFMIQGGDPKTKLGEDIPDAEWGTGSPGYAIDAEFNDIKHNRGIVSMARSASPNSAGSQFFIVHNDSNFLDTQYTVFGRIVTQESFDTLDTLASLETKQRDIPTDVEKSRIIKTEVVDRSQVTNLLELSEPERTSTPTQSSPTQDAKYSNDELGISFLAPEGWLIQEPPKTNPNVPDVVVIGPKIGDINPTVSASITFTNGRTLDERIDEIKNSLQPMIDSGEIVINFEEKTSINGKEAFTRDAVGQFQNNNDTISVKFREIIISTPEKFYTLTYSNGEKNFDDHTDLFETIVDSFEIVGIESSSTEDTTEGGGCLIATASYGSELAPQVQALRELRDNSLLKTESGSTFMSGFNLLYYSFSPTIADWERQNPIFKEVVKTTITPLIASLSILNYVEIDSESEILGYGISLILLNIGIYFVAPVVGIVKVHNHFKKNNN